MLRTSGFASRLIVFSALVSLALALLPPPASAQPFDAKYLNGMRWRSIGPYRGGRTRAVAGVPSQPNVFYIGVCNGGVWKSTDYGRRWDPIFDDQPTGSIGAIAVAPSDPEHRLCRERGGPPAARPLGRRRDLPLDGRRKDLDAPRPPRRPADPPDHRRSAQPRPGLRRRPRPSLRTERRAGHLPLDRRRADLPEGPLQGREHRRFRARLRSRRIRTSSTPGSGNRGRDRGRTRPGAGPAAACSNRPTAARPGSSSSPPGRTASSRSTWPSRRATPAASMRRSPRPAARASTARTTPARPGRGSPTPARLDRIGGGDLPRPGGPSRRIPTS